MMVIYRNIFKHVCVPGLVYTQIFLLCLLRGTRGNLQSPEAWSLYQYQWIYKTFHISSRNRHYSWLCVCTTSCFFQYFAIHFLDLSKILTHIFWWVSWWTLEWDSLLLSRVLCLFRSLLFNTLTILVFPRLPAPSPDLRESAGFCLVFVLLCLSLDTL